MLDRITKKYLQPNKKEITVHKIFRKSNGIYTSIFIRYGEYFDQPRYFYFNNIGEWTSCYLDKFKARWNDKTLIKLTGIEYPMGFHSYMLYEDSLKIFENLNTEPRKTDYVLCECRAKYRLLEGEINWVYMVGIDDSNYLMSIDREINNLTPVKVVVTRGIKITKELKNRRIK